MGCSIQKKQLPQQVSVSLQVITHVPDSEFDRIIPDTSRRPGVNIQIFHTIPMIYERNCMFPDDSGYAFPIEQNLQLVGQEQPTDDSDQFKSLDLLFRLIKPQQSPTTLEPRLQQRKNGRQNTFQGVFDCPSPKFISLEDQKHVPQRQHKKKKRNHSKKYNLDELF